MAKRKKKNLRLTNLYTIVWPNFCSSASFPGKGLDISLSHFEAWHGISLLHNDNDRL